MRNEQLAAPAIFWFWNASLTRDGIERRLDAFLERGIDSVYIHPMPNDFRPQDFHGGMTVEYLSPEFFDLISLTCDAMRQRDMTFWIYDEGGWPSGRAGGLLVREQPEFAARGLEKRNGQITEIDFLSECDYPDLMNINATKRFIELTHERYRAAVGDAFGKTIRGVFTDEPRILGRVGTAQICWSPTLSDVFENQHGYPLSDAFDYLFEVDQVDEKTHRVRRDYLRTISDEIGRCYFDPIRTWCDDYGLLFEGHHTGDHDFARHGEYFGHYLEQAERYHIPGIDAIWRQVFPGQVGGSYVSLASSSAWLRGERVASSELFAAYGQGLTFEQMRWVSAHHLVRGVNRLGLMASLESNHGSRRLGTCSDFSPQDPRWQDLDLYIDFARKAAHFTLRGEPITRAALFYRIEQLTGDAAASFDKVHEQVASKILDRLHPLLLVDEKNLSRAAAMGVKDLFVHSSAPLDPCEDESLSKADASGMHVHHVDDPALMRVPESTVIHLLSPARHVRALPLRTDEGKFELMLFNEGDAEIEVRFQWLAQPLIEHVLEDDPTLDLRALRCDDGVCRVTLLPGELRAWQAAEQWVDPPHWSVLHAHPLMDGWTVQTTERLTIKDRPVLEVVDSSPREVMLGAVEELFSGTRVYQYKIEAQINSACRYILDLGDVFDACEVWMDGQRVGRRAWSPWRIDLTEALSNGARNLSVRVTNTAAGAWLEPSVHRRDTQDWPNMYLNIAAPFMRESCRAGLAGPVWLLALAGAG